MFDQFITLMVNHHELFYITIFFIALVVGSFLNVVIHRLPTMMEKEWLCQCKELLAEEAAQSTHKSDQQAKEQEQELAEQPEQEVYNLSVPRSACPKCNHQIKAIENIPLVSYLFLRGKCSNCSAPISIRYPLVELLTAILSVVVAMVFGPELKTLLYIGTTWALIALALIDFDTMFLPDEITVPLLWAGLLASSVGLTIAPSEAIVGASVGYLSLWSVYWLFKTFTGKEGMGFGDFKLMAVFGALLGWQSVLLIVFMSSVVGTVFTVITLVLGDKSKDTKIPFGPYIAVAGWISMLWGEQMIRYYLDNYVNMNQL